MTDIGVDRAASPAPPRPRSLPAFRRLWAGQAISVVGTEVSTVALPLLAVLRLDASSFQVGVLTGLEFLGWLVLGLPVGVWVDRLPRRRVMLAADGFRLLLVGSVPVAAGLGVLGLDQLYVVAAGLGIGTVFFDVAYQSYLPVVLPGSALLAGNGVLQGTESTARVAGPALGGLLVQLVGAPYAVLADTASYLVSLGYLAALRVPEPPIERVRGTRLRAELAEGWQFLRGHPVLRPLTIALIVLNACAVAQSALYVPFLVRTLGVPAGGVGLLLAAGGVGGLGGALVGRRLAERFGSARVLWLTLLGEPVSALAVAATPAGAGVALFAFATGFAGLAVVVFNVVGRAWRQQVTPQRMLGRVTATMRFATYGVIPVAALAGGALGSLLGNRPGLAVAGAAYFLAPLCLLRTPVARLRDLPLGE